MSYTTPLTAVANATLTAAQWNASVRDNFLETAVGKATAANQVWVSTGSTAGASRTSAHDSYSGGGTDSTNSTTYTALTGGCIATATTGTRATVFSTVRVSHDTIGNRWYVSYSISGATTVAADDLWAVVQDNDRVNDVTTATYISQHISSMTAGSNTFTHAFKVGAGTMTSVSRRLTIYSF